MIKFKVEVNPFLRKAVISSKIREILYTKIIYYEDIDEWNSFEFDGKTFDIQFHYEAEFLVSIYSVEKNKIDYTKNYDVELIFKMTD
jgi:hypothetical protein